jgi:hypothetical protein
MFANVIKIYVLNFLLEWNHYFKYSGGRKEKGW